MPFGRQPLPRPTIKLYKDVPLPSHLAQTCGDTRVVDMTGTRKRYIVEYLRVSISVFPGVPLRTPLETLCCICDINNRAPLGHVSEFRVFTRPFWESRRQKFNRDGFLLDDVDCLLHKMMLNLRPAACDSLPHSAVSAAPLTFSSLPTACVDFLYMPM